MRVLMYGTQRFEREIFSRALERAATAGAKHDWAFTDTALNVDTAPLAGGCDAVCAFVNDRLDAGCVQALARLGVRLVALRSAGYNHVDLLAAEQAGLTVARVPAYSPHAVAEHAVALILTLNRKTHRAYNRVREHNFALDGLLGFDMRGKTVACVGTGRIGAAFCRIMLGFGCHVTAFDPQPSAELRSLGVTYLDLDTLWPQADVIALHCPLRPETRHLVDASAIRRMKRGVMLVNTSRGAVVDTRAVIAALKDGHIGALGLDVYEEEGDLFFRDLSSEVLHDEIFARLLTFPNVLVTAHQGFFTGEAVDNIAETTVSNVTDFERGTLDPACVVHSAAHLRGQNV